MQPQAASRPHQPNPFLHQDSSFIRHPDNSPFELRPLPLWQLWRQPNPRSDSLGVVCHSRRYWRAGSWVNLVIPVRDEHEHFAARVVMVRETACGYDIGLRLAKEDDGARLRIVEQFCYMECYCRNVDDELQPAGHEQDARDWVATFAATFPSL